MAIEGETDHGAVENREAGMKMRVVNVAYPFALIRPDTAGGAEQVLLQLDRALTEKGHTSIVVAPQGSQVDGIHIQIPQFDSVDELSRIRAHRCLLHTVDRVVSTHGADLIHYHGIDFHRYLSKSSTAALVTLHLPLSWYPASAFSCTRPATFFNCVSEHQYRDAPMLPEYNTFCIPNGVEVPCRYRELKRGRYAVAMGRICPEKNFHEAFLAAQEAGIALVLAGSVFRYREHLKYFSEKIVPLLHNFRHKFVGQVDFKAKQKLLSRAQCCLITSRAPETSSLVAMEALAAGTPVIAYPSGALAEIVEDGVTGFLVNDYKEMTHTVKNVTKIDKSVCYSRALQRFSNRTMTQSYLQLYRSILEKAKGLRVGLP